MADQNRFAFSDGLAEFGLADSSTITGEGHCTYVEAAESLDGGGLVAEDFANRSSSDPTAAIRSGSSSGMT
jgi:hypothetical protein